MASKLQRADDRLPVPEMPKLTPQQFKGTMASTLPMAAVSTGSFKPALELCSYSTDVHQKQVCLLTYAQVLQLGF